MTATKIASLLHLGNNLKIRFEPDHGFQMAEPSTISDITVEAQVANEASPRIWIKSATFSDGSTLSFSKDDIVVIVGPNNAGKSESLRSLRMRIQRPDDVSKVINDIQLGHEGTTDEVKKWLAASLGAFRDDAGHAVYMLYGHQVRENAIENFDTNVDVVRQVAPFFCHLLDAESRLRATRPPNAIDLLHESPQHPVHRLQRDDNLENKISRLFRKAFGKDLMLHRNVGKVVPIYCGQRPEIDPGEDRISSTYIEKIEKIDRLELQGDGMRSYAGVLLYTFAVPYTVVLIDEPEAFLHPPQARFLGASLASENAGGRQLLVATHSGDVLRGLLDSGSTTLRVVRITREENINRVCELDSQKIAELWQDPLLRIQTFSTVYFTKKWSYARLIPIADFTARCLTHLSIPKGRILSGLT